MQVRQLFHQFLIVDSNNPVITIYKSNLEPACDYLKINKSAIKKLRENVLKLTSKQHCLT